MEEEKTKEQFGISQWFKDNLRIIVSVAVVIIIAGGIYSYSKRTQPEEMSLAPEIEESTLENEVEPKTENENQAEKTETDTDKKATIKEAPKGTVATQTPEEISSETEKSFVETATRGNGVTHLARRALANYLEKNPDSSLTPEHKIYIEDYLRKNVGFTGRVFVGTTVSFEKDLIRQAIEHSKKLNDNQLKNLHKYSVMVPSLT